MKTTIKTMKRKYLKPEEMEFCDLISLGQSATAAAHEIWPELKQPHIKGGRLMKRLEIQCQVQNTGAADFKRVREIAAECGADYDYRIRRMCEVVTDPTSKPSDVLTACSKLDRAEGRIQGEAAVEALKQPKTQTVNVQAQNVGFVIDRRSQTDSGELPAVCEDVSQDPDEDGWPSAIQAEQDPELPV